MGAGGEWLRLCQRGRLTVPNARRDQCSRSFGVIDSNKVVQLHDSSLTEDTADRGGSRRNRFNRARLTATRAAPGGLQNRVSPGSICGQSLKTRPEGGPCRSRPSARRIRPNSAAPASFPDDLDNLGRPKRRRHKPRRANQFKLF
jgi:hypothetical protein